MSDDRQLDDLLRPLAEAGERTTPALAPDQVRRLGQQRRHRRRTGIAAAALGLALVTGVGVLTQTDLLGSARPPRFAATPSATPSRPSTAPPAAVPITAADLPTTDEVYLDTPGDLGKFPLAGRSPAPTISVCLADATGLAGLTAHLERRFVVENTDDPYYVHVALLQFGSAQQATASINTLIRAYAECPGTREGMIFTSVRDADYPLGDAVARAGLTPTRGVMFQTMKRDPASDVGTFENVNLLQIGDRVEWIVESLQGMDNNCGGPGSTDPAGPCRVSARIDAIAGRMLPD